jgi:uncharacterized protein (DUF2236 family)
MNDSRPPLEMREIGREAILIAGGARAILLQIANPGVGAGVAEHSDFTHRPLDRLRTTLTYVYGVTYGTPEEIRKVSSAVTAVHRKVVGPAYDANDPELQLWVAATLYDTALLVHGEIFGPLDDATNDLVYEQYAALGTALRVPASLWPANRVEFRRYWDEMVATVEISDGAHRVANDILHPRHAPRMIRAAAPLSRFLTSAWLPPRLREEYGLHWDDRRQRRYDAMMRVARSTYPHLPMKLRESVRDRYLADMRRRMGSGRRVVTDPA